MQRNTIFTNVGMTPEREPWWEGIGGAPPAGLINWKGEAWDTSKGPAAHPEFALHRAGASVAQHFAAVGSAGRRADFRIYFWRTPRARCAAGV